jgi:hypothetical protein
LRSPNEKSHGRKRKLTGQVKTISRRTTSSRAGHLREIVFFVVVVIVLLVATEMILMDETKKASLGRGVLIRGLSRGSGYLWVAIF